MWALFAVISAVVLGIYDIFKKLSLDKNAVIPVLFFSTLTSAIIFAPLMILSVVQPQWLEGSLFYVPVIDIRSHGFIFLKAIIVTASWILTFFAVKHLPLTIVSPVRATGPLWTLAGAILIFAERLTLWQWVGIVVTLLFFYLFSVAGRSEGIHFRSNKWVYFLLAGTLLGGISGLYDKFLIRHFDRMAVQSWSTIYQVAMLLPVLLLLWYPQRAQSTPFVWRRSIPMIALFLCIADFLYFYAISYEGSLISVISALRRSGVVISFTLGALVFHEKNIRQKAWLLAGILAGVMILLFGSRG